MSKNLRKTDVRGVTDLLSLADNLGNESQYSVVAIVSLPRENDQYDVILAVSKKIGQTVVQFQNDGHDVDEGFIHSVVAGVSISELQQIRSHFKDRSPTYEEHILSVGTPSITASRYSYYLRPPGSACISRRVNEASQFGVALQSHEEERFYSDGY